MAVPFEERPKSLHRIFTERVLRSIAERDAASFVRLAIQGSAGDGLKKAWAAAGEVLPFAQRSSSDGLAVAHYDRAGFVIVLVTLPIPSYPPEAYFVAVVVKDDILQRYMVLELSSGADGSPLTAVAEWLSDTHVSIGAGPDPSPTKFIDAIEALLARAN